jgi:tetrahydromethanopterin S-methyltransferase subunit G
MAILGERVEVLEGHMNEHSQAIERLEQRVGHLEQRVELGFEENVRRFDAADRRFDSIDRRFERLEDKVSRQFVWTVSIQITVLLAVVGSLLSVATR